jgi:hypothetical protein
LRRCVEHLAIVELADLGDTKLKVVDGTIESGTSRVDLLERLLQHGDASRGDVVEAVIEAEVLEVEQAVEDDGLMGDLVRLQRREA